MGRTPGEASRRPGLAIVGLGLFVACSVRFENFLGADNINAIALNSSTVLIAALGSMALLVSGNLDLSIGSQYALVSVVTALVLRDTGNAWLGAGAALLLGLLLGLVNGMLVEFLSISPLIVTLAMLAVYRGLAYVAGDGVSVFNLPRSIVEFGQWHLLGVPAAVYIALAAFGAGSWLLTSTVSGLRLYAIGGDRVTARLLGVPVSRLVVQTYAANGALIGLLALLSTAQLASGSPTVGVQFELDVLTAVILGGVSFTGGNGHPLGVLVGVATIGVLDAGLIFAGLADWYQQIARGSLLLLALVADQVLLRRRRVRRAVRAPAADDQPAPVARPPSATGDGAEVLAVRDVTVRFRGADVLTGVNLTIRAGEIVCLVGDNGAGKSTLIKVICGAVRPSAGRVELAHTRLRAQPRRAREAGIEAVHQKPALCPNLSAVDNLVLGMEPARRLFGVLRIRDIRAAHELAQSRLAGLGISITGLRRPIGQLSGGEQQVIAILRALRADAQLILLDEPTAVLGVKQGSEVLRFVRSIAATGRPVIFVTHDVEEVFDIADRIVVLQHGRVIYNGPAAKVSRLELLRLMSGRNRAEAARTVAAVTNERLRIERDLHDGAQQQLINAALLLRMATDQLRDSPNEKLNDLLTSSGETIRAALSELRDLSRGIFPAMLTERGLGAALESLTMRSVLPVEITCHDVPRFTESIELAAYFVAAEAVANAHKYAHAEVVTVDVDYGPQGLLVVVADDGTGGADEGRGSGLRGLRERVQSAGGTLLIDSRAGAGTRLTAAFPNAVGVEPDDAVPVSR